MEVSQCLVTRHEVAHMNVNCRKPGAVECRRHLHLPIDALFSQNRHFGTRAGCNKRRCDVVITVKSERR